MSNHIENIMSSSFVELSFYNFTSTKSIVFLGCDDEKKLFQMRNNGTLIIYKIDESEKNRIDKQLQEKKFIKVNKLYLNPYYITDIYITDIDDGTNIKFDSNLEIFNKLSDENLKKIYELIGQRVDLITGPKNNTICTKVGIDDIRSQLGPEHKMEDIFEWLTITKIEFIPNGSCKGLIDQDWWIWNDGNTYPLVKHDDKLVNSWVVISDVSKMRVCDKHLNIKSGDEIVIGFGDEMNGREYRYKVPTDSLTKYIDNGKLIFNTNWGIISFD